MIIVCDTNIFVSAAEFGGTTRAFLDEVSDKGVDIAISPDILLEIERVLRKKFYWISYEIDDLIETLISGCVLIKPSEKINKITRDPSDNRILECAISAKADFVVSGDKKHLLPLKKFRGIPIYSPQEFLREVLYD